MKNLSSLGIWWRPPSKTSGSGQFMMTLTFPGATPRLMSSRRHSSVTVMTWWLKAHEARSTRRRMRM